MLTAPVFSMDLFFNNVCFASDEAIAAFLEISGGSLKELSLNNVSKVSNSFTIFSFSPLSSLSADRDAPFSFKTCLISFSV